MRRRWRQQQLEQLRRFGRLRRQLGHRAADPAQRHQRRADQRQCGRGAIRQHPECFGNGVPAGHERLPDHRQHSARYGVVRPAASQARRRSRCSAICRSRAHPTNGHGSRVQCPGADHRRSVVDLGANGILGIGSATYDRGSSCVSLAQNGTYFSCSNGQNCTGVVTPLAQQVINPVTKFAADTTA